MLIYGLLKTLMVSAIGWIYWLLADTLNRKISKNIYFLKINLKLKINKIILKITS